MRRTILFLLLSSGLLMADSYEKLFVNGKIYTVAQDGAWVEAVIVRGDRVWKTGTAAELRRLSAPDAEVIDLGGRFMMPGFVDAHVHFFEGGRNSLQIPLKDCVDSADFEKRVAEYARQFAPGEWIDGGGWDHEAWPDKKLPTKELLDRAAPHNPVWLSRHDGHMGVASSMALKLAGITRDTKAPEGGEIGHDESGEPNGILRDNAEELIGAVIPPLTRPQVEKAARAALAEAARLGVTTVLDMGTSPLELTICNDLQTAGDLTTRIYACLPVSELENVAAIGITNGLGSNLLRIQGVKLFADGSMGAGTALFFEPYKDRPQTSGLAVMSEKEMEERIQKADAAGLQLHIHAIGDRAIWMVLDDLSRLPPRDRRAKIEHVQVVRRQDYGLFATTRTVASVQPCHVLDDMHWCEKRVGERCKDGYPYGSLHRAGIPLAFGTDWPVEPLNPWLGVYAAVTRRDLKGEPAGGWFPEERVPLADSLRAYTMGSAYSCFMEKELGSIEPGKLADLAVISSNPFDIPPEKLKDLTTWMTVMNGRIVYRAK